MLDINLPDMTGWDVLAVLRDAADSADIPVMSIPSTTIASARLSQARANIWSSPPTATCWPRRRTALRARSRHASEPAGSPAISTRQDCVRGSPMRILIAEDHPDNREMLTRRLERRGYEVVMRRERRRGR